MTQQRLRAAIESLTCQQLDTQKLGLEDNLGLFRYGIRNGLISV